MDKESALSLARSVDIKGLSIASCVYKKIVWSIARGADKKSVSCFAYSVDKQRWIFFPSMERIKYISRICEILCGGS